MITDARTNFRDGLRVTPAHLTHLQQTLAEAVVDLRTALGLGRIAWGLRLSVVAGTATLAPGVIFAATGVRLGVTTAVPLVLPAGDGTWRVVVAGSNTDEPTLRIDDQPTLVRTQTVVVVQAMDMAVLDDALGVGTVTRTGATITVAQDPALWLVPAAHGHSGNFYQDSAGRWRFDGAGGAMGPAGPAGADGAAGAPGPAGADGVDGAAGPQGPAGADGAAGPQGPAGADGAVGAPGPVGPDGVAGPQGPAGADGATGLQGPAGADGAAGPLGPVGANGVAGPPGQSGSPGMPGAIGADGQPGAKGDKGDTGDAGAVGQPGAKGDKGDVGAAGPNGQAGPKGDQGNTGTTGQPGAKGDKGDAGAAGQPGAKGADGASGAQGPAGPGFEAKLTRLVKLAPAESPIAGAAIIATFQQGGLLASFSAPLDPAAVKAEGTALVEAWAVGRDGVGRMVTGMADVVQQRTLRWRCDAAGAAVLKATLSQGIGALLIRVDGERLRDVDQRPVCCVLLALAFPTLVLPPGGQLHLQFPVGG